MNERTSQSFFLILSKECLTQIPLITVFSFLEKKISVAVVKWWNTKQSIWCEQFHADTPIHATSMMCVQNNMYHFCLYDTYCLGHCDEEDKERTKTSNWILDQFSLSFVNKPLLTWMLYFHVWLQNKWKILSLEWIL